MATIIGNKQKISEKEWYEEHKGMFDYFFKQHLPFVIMLDTLKNLSKGDFTRLIKFAEKHDPATFDRIAKYDEELTAFYNNALDRIIEILSADVKKIKEDKTPLNTLAYLINYHDLVGFSHTDFYKLVIRKNSNPEFTKILMDDYRATDSFHMTGKTVLNYNSFKTDGSLIYFDENESSRIAKIFNREITDEDYKYCIAKLEENGIPLLFKAVEGAVKAYAKDSLDEFIDCIKQRRYLTEEELDLIAQADNHSNAQTELELNENESKNSKAKVPVIRHNTKYSYCKII